MTVDFIITTLNKTKEEIVSILDKSNIKGHILVGNQGQLNETSYKIEGNQYSAVVFNEVSTGVSLNRNFLLSKSCADYVIFLDDDAIIRKEINFDVFSGVKSSAIRFNCISSNSKRPIKLISKNKILKFKDVKSYGVWGIFFRRNFLLEKNLKFDENVGPGRYVNHGEDTLFLKQYFKYGGKLFQNSETLFVISQETSTWKDGDVERELISHGFIYKKIFGKLGKIYLYYYFFRHKNEIKNEHEGLTSKYIMQTLLKGYKGCFDRSNV